MKEINTEFKLIDTDEDNVEYNLGKDGEHNFSYFAGSSVGGDSYWNTKITDSFSWWDKEKHASIISQLAMELHWNFNAGIDSVMADHWFGVSVSATVWDDKHENYEIVNIFMECDDVQIGVFACVEMLKKIILQKDEEIIDTENQ